MKVFTFRGKKIFGIVWDFSRYHIQRNKKKKEVKTTADETKLS